MPRVSIIIAVKAPNPNLSECLAGCLELDYPDYEIIVCPDEDFAPPDSRIQVLPTGPVGPAEKRDRAAHVATGDILAFLDDDAFSTREWLSRASENFAEPSVGAVGGPAVTPADDSPAAQASGQVYASWAGGGNYAYRYLPQAKRTVDDYPTCNLLVRRVSFEAVGGFDTHFWPGEDTKLCLDITQGLEQKIVYDPAVLVHHRRRPLFGPHLRQVRSYGLHRGYFAKRFPTTSLRPSYFLPTALVAGLVGGWPAAAAWPALRGVYLSGLLVYLAFVIVSAAIAARPLRLMPLVAAGILATHITYGVWFVVGLLSPKLREEK